MPCIPVPTLALQRTSVLACMAQHLLEELGGNLAMCQWEKNQLVSNTYVVCATIYYVEFKDSSMHALLTLVFKRGIEYFNLSNRCELHSAPSGRLSFRLVDSKNL